MVKQTVSLFIHSYINNCKIMTGILVGEYVRQLYDYTKHRLFSYLYNR
jgi:hypothetical protein